MINKCLVGYLIKTLKKESGGGNFNVLAYVFMPDHLHLVLSFEKGGNLVKKIKNFKQITSYRFKQKTGKPLWQKSYYDHVVRKDENINNVIKYIFNNPVRANLVEVWHEYPFLGSFEFDIEEYISN